MKKIIRRVLSIAALLVLLFAAVYLYFFIFGGRSVDYNSRVETDLQAISSQVKVYKEITANYPSTTQGLVALVSRPPDLNPQIRWVQLFHSIPSDPWGQAYRYRSPETAEEGLHHVFSLGPDGIESDDDIGISIAAQQGAAANP